MPSIAVVFASYLEVPESRLRDHFEWNAALYEPVENGVRVYVVTDREYDLPAYAQTVIIPIEEMPVVGGKPRFSLSMAKNRGITQAVYHGYETIIATDVDMAFDYASFKRMATVGPGEAVVPLYRMVNAFDDRVSGRLDMGCTGTVSMSSVNWGIARYNEKCVGYGADDGILLRDIKRAGVSVKRDCEVAHVAHVTGDGARTPGSGSDTCWGRESGFNFDNFAANRKHHKRQ